MACFLPCCSPAVTGHPWSTYLFMLHQRFYECYGLLSFFFFHIVIRPIFHICLPVTLHFFLSLSNVPTLTVMRKIHGSGEIALFQYRRGRCTNYSSTQIKLLTAVIPSYYRSSTLERHTDLPLQCTAPVTIVFRIIRRFSVVPWMPYNRSCSAFS